MEARKHRSFPNLTFLNLAIAQKRIYAVTFRLSFFRPVPCRQRQKHPVPGSLLDISTPGICIQTGMSLQDKNQDDAVSPDPPTGKKPLCARAEYRPGAVCPLERTKRSRSSFFGSCRINIHLFKIQVGKDICCRKRSSRMTGFCAMYSSQNALADFIRHFGKFQIIHNSSHSAAKTAQKLTTYFTLYHILL